MSGTSQSDGPKRSSSKSSASTRSGKRGVVKQIFAIGAPNDWRAWLQRLLVLLIAFVLVCVGAFVIAYESTTIPDPNAAYQTQTTNVFYADGSQLGTFATQKRESVPLTDVAQTMQDAVVAAEDRTFWTNNGIDFKSIVRSAFNNAGGGATQGGSTIAMQYVKILYLNEAQTITRKIKQVFLALKIQKQESKAQILEGYLNTIYFGRGAYGVEVAAETYFGVPASKLTVAQAAVLAAEINQPSYLDPTGSPAQKAALLARYQYVLDGMVKMGNLAAATEASIYNALPPVVDQSVTNEYGGQNGFALAMVKQQLLALGFTEQQIYGAGLRVTTTLQPAAMAASQAAVTSVEANAVEPGQDPSQLHAATASIDVKTGALIGFYAGQNFLTSQYNWATAPNPPGSVFKVPALAMALSNGWSLKSTFDGDSPIDVNGTELQNDGEAQGIANGQSYGRHVTLLEGLRESINTVFLDMTMSTPDGANKIKRMALAMGAPASTSGWDSSPGQTSDTIALGVASVAPVDIANMYSTVANGGREHPWYMISKVTDSTGKVLWTHQDKETQVMTSQVAADVTSAMQAVVQSGTGTTAKGINRPAAGKTGTATNEANATIGAWFAGFTPQVATAVMYVRGNGRLSLNGYLRSAYGADDPARTWTETMNGIDKMPAYSTVEQFPSAANLPATNNISGHQAYTPPPPTYTYTPPAATTAPTAAPTQNTPAPVQQPSREPQPSGPPSPTCTPALLRPC